MKKFAVIFDMDGTMVNNTPYHLRSWQALYEKYELGTLAPETYYNEISGVPIMSTVKRLFNNADIEHLEAIHLEKEALYKELYAPFVAPVNGLEDLLIELKGAGIKLAMASSATVGDIDFILSHIPLRRYFDVIIDGQGVSKGKPDPQIFLKAAAELQMRPEDCVVFEDSLAGIKAGNAAGMKVIGITTGNQPEKLKPSNMIIDDFTELNVQKLATLFDQ